LRVKIPEENDARKHNSRDNTSDAMTAKPWNTWKKSWIKRQELESKDDVKEHKTNSKQKFLKYKCNHCHKPGHKASECRSKGANDANAVEDLSLCAENVTSCFQSANNKDEAEWCVDSGCSSHMCGKCEKFTIVDDSVNGEVRLANQSSTYIKGKDNINRLHQLAQSN